MQRTVKGLYTLCFMLLSCSISAAAKYSPKSCSDEDTVFVIPEDELVEELKQIVKEYRAAKYPKTQVNGISLSKDDMRLLKYQLFLNLLQNNTQPIIAQQPGYVRDAQGNTYYVPQNKDESPVWIYPGNSQYIPIGANGLLGGGNYYTYPSGTVARTTSELGENGQKRTKEQTEMPALMVNSLTGTNEQRITDDIVGENERQTSDIPQVHLSQIQQEGAFDPAVGMNTELSIPLDKEQDLRLLAPYFKRQVFFRQSSKDLDQRARKTLDEAIEVIKKHEHSTLYLVGYASPEGNKNFNKALAQKRSQAVNKYLLEHGIQSNQLKIVEGKIDQQPGIATIARRVDLNVVQNNN